MSVFPVQWQAFSSPEEQLTYLKEHKLTPKTFTAPKELYYAGIYQSQPVICTVEGYVDNYTAVIKVGDEYHCIHPDYLLEMQSGRSGVRRSPSRRQGTAAPKEKEKENAVDFVAIDFETATSNHNSACSLGIALVQGLEVVETWYHLIQPPENSYEAGTVRVHGITPAQTENQPTSEELWPEIRRFFDKKLVVLAHNARFDTSVLRNSFSGAKELPNFKYGDTLKMVKEIVPGRHGLDACCEYFGIELEHHHNALDDAIACAKIAIACVKLAGCDSFSAYVKQQKLSLADFHQKSFKSYNPYASKAVRISDLSATVEQFDMTHPLYQKNIVFTGDLELSRSDAMQLALNKGAVVKSSVSAKTDVLVIGRQGQTPETPVSSKEKKARELIAAGKELKILEEAEFLALVKE
jgi:DNA polymerase-3 subunit epsilon